MITVFVVSPMPHQRMSRGIMLKGGTFRKNCTRYSKYGPAAGSTARTIPSINARTKAIKKPRNTRAMLMATSSKISPDSHIFRKLSSTFPGGGST